MQNWTDEIDREARPKYAAIAAALARAIHEGRLRPGARLPAQRELADALGVDLTTVTRAYGIARDDGLIEGSGRLGSFVRNDAAIRLPQTDDVGMNMPPQPASALLDEALRRGMAALLRAGGATPLLQYQPRGGNRHDRATAALAMTAYGLPAEQDMVIVTAGGQNALHAILAAGIGSGAILAAGRHTYPGLLGIAARLGLPVIPVDGDDQGLDPDAVVDAARAGATVLYVVPTNDNPTAATMGLDRRREIAAVARRSGLTIIEDDAYGRLPQRPLTPIAALAPELCWHIASVSKIVSPALRVAHVLAPSVADAARLAADVHETAVMAPPLSAALVSLWLRDGTFEALVAAVRAEAVVRRRLIAHHLTELDVAMHPEGYHVWLLDGSGRGPQGLADALRPTGLSAVPGDRFLVDRAQPSPYLRLSIGGAIGHERLVRAFDHLARFGR